MSFVLLLVAHLVTGAVFAQSARTAPSVPGTASARFETARNVLMEPGAAMKELSALLKARRFAAPLFGLIEYDQLRPQNCFGITFESGSSLVGESSAGNYGLEYIREGQPRQSAIGMLSISGRLAIGGVAVPPGQYIVFASPATLTFMNDDRANAKSRAGHSIPLPETIDDASLVRSSTRRPRMRLAVAGVTVTMTLARNELVIGSQQ